MLLVVAAACSDRALTPPGETGGQAGERADGQTGGAAAGGQAPIELAKMVAKGLKNPAFRAYLKAQLDASPYREHKLQFETFLTANSAHALRQIAGENGASPDLVAKQAKQAIALEVYFPVPEHAKAWTGDERVLVATALRDQDSPIAFDPDGRRLVLDAKTPPQTPVLALVPVETDFSLLPGRQACIDCSGGYVPPPTPPPPPPPGLYMTKAHFVQDFEGWLKGSPEFEVQILGQKGQTDSLISYQCAGEHAGGPYTFDQNGHDWTGRVLLFSRQQLDQYNAAHPQSNIRVFVVEDDDTACQIRTDPERFQKVIFSVDSAYNRLTAGNDSSTVIRKYYGYARAAYSVFQAVASWIKTNDELVGTAVEDRIVGAFYPGFNWFVKGENNITNGWINLVLY
ncbi:MAG TPA: hypothetical protein VFM23_06540 [Gemmatimonadales bacterium]|nr:hypothetical protein [Gemmatimonadales bacterium]